VSRAHDRFEALAGALALGEATDAEREQFTEHARTCALCAEDTAALPATLALVGEARESERWQPSLGGELAERLRSRRETRSRRTFASLGFGIVASLALNVLFVAWPARTPPHALAPGGGTRVAGPPRKSSPVRRAEPPAVPEVVAGLALVPGDIATLGPEERCAATGASLDAAPAPCPATPASALFR
jgi:hypothetical protein